jgi:4-aminobutyrate aminotransferase/(S)-3-amino-2-methylpropionate transaminase
MNMAPNLCSREFKYEEMMPTNAELFARRKVALPDALATSLPVFASDASNAEIIDVEGKRYIDFAAGIATLNTGHCHPRVIAAVREQLEHFTHTAFQVVGYEKYVELCERLNTIAPIAGKAKSVLFSTGAEATENAIKIARYVTGRSAIISFSGAFHGRTLLAMAMTGKVEPYKAGFGSLPGEVYHAVFPVEHRGISNDDARASLDFLFKTTVDPQRVAAIIVEPVQGEGGFNPAPAEFLRTLRDYCSRFGIMLIADEVQTGFGRTGKMFAIEHSGVEPDLIAVAKSLGGGFPISGVIGRAEIMGKVQPGGLGATYGGSPISCAAALAVLDVIADEGLIERADQIGRRILEHLNALSLRNDVLPIRNIRGIGAMIAFDIAADQITGQADGVTAKRVVARAAEKGLILLTCGMGGESIRLLTPLTIPLDLLDEGFGIMSDVLKELFDEYAGDKTLTVAGRH